MLLPSALPCGPRPRLQRMAAYSSQSQVPQPSPPETPPTGQRIGGTCDALQSVLGTQSRGKGSPRSHNLNNALHARARVSKRPPLRPRSKVLGKRGIDDDYDDEDETDRAIATHGYGLGLSLGDQREQRPSGGRGSGKISTPKRLRRAPPSLPFGLDHDDFLGLGVDEGLDDAMTEEGMEKMETQKALPDDEGYGSMEFQPGQLRAALLSSSSSSSSSNSNQKQLQMEHLLQDQQPLPSRGGISPLFQAPSREAADSDAMSIGTPNSGLAAMALSPNPMHTSKQSPMPSHPFLPFLQTDPITSPQKDSSDPPLPTLSPPASSLSPSDFSISVRPTVQRLPSLAHSDPLLPTPFTPSNQDDALFFDSDDRAPLSSEEEEEQQHRKEKPTHQQRSLTPDGEAAGPASSSTWSDADDRALVGLVLDKLRLKKCDWDACARALGADGQGASLGRRWRDLVGDGCVGMKFRYGGAVVGYRRPGREEKNRGRDGDGGDLGFGVDEDDDADSSALGRRVPAVRSRARRGDVRAVRWS